MGFELTSFWVEVLVRWADGNSQNLFALKKGDADRGLILLRQDMKNGKVRIWVQTFNQDQESCFRRQFAEDLDKETAEEFVKREVAIDDDLWVIVMENSNGHLPPILKPFQQK